MVFGSFGMQWMKIKKSSRAFTLIELMITVGIIGLLASIAIPAFEQFMIRARLAEAPIFLSELGHLEVSFFTKPRILGSNTEGTPCFLITSGSTRINNFPGEQTPNILDKTVCLSSDSNLSTLGFSGANGTADCSQRTYFDYQAAPMAGSAQIVPFCLTPTDTVVTVSNPFHVYAWTTTTLFPTNSNMYQFEIPVSVDANNSPQLGPIVDISVLN